jgi:hypothetical protein
MKLEIWPQQPHHLAGCPGIREIRTSRSYPSGVRSILGVSHHDYQHSGHEAMISAV